MKKTTKRISFNLNLTKRSHRQIYNLLQEESNMTATIIEALLFYDKYKDYDFKEDNVQYKELFYQAFEAMTSGLKTQGAPVSNSCSGTQENLPYREEVKEPEKEIDEVPSEEDVDGFLDGLAAFDELG